MLLAQSNAVGEKHHGSGSCSDSGGTIGGVSVAGCYAILNVQAEYVDVDKADGIQSFSHMWSSSVITKCCYCLL